MSAATINLDIEAGSTFDHTMQWLDSDGVTPINMIGASAYAEFREEIDSETVLLTMSTANGKLSINTSTGVISFHLSATETAGFTFTQSVYDLEIHFPPVNNEVPIYRIAKGKCKVSKEVTRSF